MSVKNITIYTCDKCKEEYRFEGIKFEDKDFCTEQCLREYLYDNQAEKLWNKCCKVTKFEGNYYLNDRWRIHTAFKANEKDSSKNNVRKDCLVLAVKSVKGYGNGEIGIFYLNTYKTDFERPSPRNTDIYCNGQSSDQYKYSLIVEPERDIKYFEEFLQDAIDGSDYISDRD